MIVTLISLELMDQYLPYFVPKKEILYQKTLFSEKLLAFLYSSMIKFCRTAKIKKFY